MKSLTNKVNNFLIVILAFLVLSVGSALLFNSMDISTGNISFIAPIPTTIIIGIGTVDAINLFSGEPITGYGIDAKTLSILSSILIYLFLAPYLLFAGFKKAKTTGKTFMPWYWYIGGVLMIGAFSIIPTLILNVVVRGNMLESAEKSRTMDKMRQELADVSLKLVEYELVSDGINPAFTISDLDIDGLKYDYEIYELSGDTLVKISATNEVYPDQKVDVFIRPYEKNNVIVRN
ncbi:MAG TPA: hypothetical protein DEQ34_05195 [Balneolaceae bacterium]|nr:hypothetical protein [Balneolaceae bacterium]|tara:strand:+ start:144192 stop:144893 length:702 start_codon:yes stop_codon:yes gene_type:complete